MTNSLFDILAKKNFDEPTDVTAVKKFVKDAYNIEVQVFSSENELTIQCNSASFANALRLSTRKMQAYAHTKKRFVFRIG
jgi:hypothetical protein